LPARYEVMMFSLKKKMKLAEMARDHANSQEMENAPLHARVDKTGKEMIF